jgi:hypothetical protein
MASRAWGRVGGLHGSMWRCTVGIEAVAELDAPRPADFVADFERGELRRLLILEGLQDPGNLVRLQICFSQQDPGNLVRLQVCASCSRMEVLLPRGGRPVIGLEEAAAAA